MTPAITWRWTRVGLCAVVVIAGCSEVGAPLPMPPALVVEGTVTDSVGVPIPGSGVQLWLNYVFNWPYYADTFADSLGRFSLRFDSLPTPLDSIVGIARGPGCFVSGEAYSVPPPTGSLSSETVLSTQITLSRPLPHATGDTGRLYGIASDEGLFGYSGCLYMLIEQSAVYQPTSVRALLGRWHIIWSPSYGDNVGTFRGEQTATRVSLEFEEDGCKTNWEGPVSPGGAWGTLVPTSEACPSNWGMFPVALARDTASGVWP